MITSAEENLVELIDQEYCELNDPVQANVKNNSDGQSFKPSMPVLSSVALQLLYPKYDVTVTICKAKLNGYPDLSNPLTCISANVFDSYGNYGFWYRFDFVDVPVTPGDTYFILVDILDEDECNWVQGADGYADGSSWAFLISEDHGFECPARDYFFRTYYSTTVFPPVAQAGPDQEVTIGESVNLSGNGSYDPDGTIVSYIWNLGDGTIITGNEVSHVYTASGSYTVRLVVTDNHKIQASDSCVITVKALPPPPNQSPVAIIEVEGYLGHYFNLPCNHSEIGGQITGNVTGDSPFNHDWYDDQYYSFTRLDPDLAFGGTFFPVDEGLTGDPLYFAVHWETTIEVSASGVYTFEIGSDDDSWVYVDNQMICDLGGIHGLDIQPYTFYIEKGEHVLDIYFAERHKTQSGFYFEFTDADMNPHCKASDLSDKVHLLTNHTYFFNAEKSYDIDGDIIRYQWDFGDGKYNISSSAAHVFISSGDVQISLIVTDNCNDSSSQNITLHIITSNSGDPEEILLHTDYSVPSDDVEYDTNDESIILGETSDILDKNQISLLIFTIIIISSSIAGVALKYRRE